MYCPSLVQPDLVARDFHFFGPLKIFSEKMFLIWLGDESLGDRILNRQLRTGLSLEKEWEGFSYTLNQLVKWPWFSSEILVYKECLNYTKLRCCFRESCLPYTVSCYRCWDHCILILTFYCRWTKVSLAFTSPPGHGTDTDDMVSSILKVIGFTLILVFNSVAVYYLFITIMP
jgi:hypothetical protein